MEYFLNAKIVSANINAKAWEILLSIILMEHLFGVAGVVAAPIFYAWMKAEWHSWDAAPKLSSFTPGLEGSDEPTPVVVAAVTS
jgi:predicted PurR-regulated permease PerM